MKSKKKKKNKKKKKKLKQIETEGIIVGTVSGPVNRKNTELNSQSQLKTQSSK